MAYRLSQPVNNNSDNQQTNKRPNNKQTKDNTMSKQTNKCDQHCYGSNITGSLRLKAKLNDSFVDILRSNVDEPRYEINREIKVAQRLLNKGYNYCVLIPGNTKPLYSKTIEQAISVAKEYDSKDIRILNLLDNKLGSGIVIERTNDQTNKAILL